MSAFFLSKCEIMKENQIKVEQKKLDSLSETTKKESKILFGVVMKFILLYMVLLMFDVLLDGLVAIFDLAIELVHILIEIMELLLEEGLEKFFHTKHHQSEMIIINVALIITFIIFYYSIKALPHLIVVMEKQLIRRLRANWQSSLLHWQSYSMKLKLKLIVAYLLGIFGLTLLLG